VGAVEMLMFVRWGMGKRVAEMIFLLGMGQFVCNEDKSEKGE